MPLKLRQAPPSPQRSPRTIELRNLVARLEFARHEALQQKDQAEANRLDEQLAQVGKEWAESLAMDYEVSREKKTA
jgi:hypothetical protein